MCSAGTHVLRGNLCAQGAHRARADAATLLSKAPTPGLRARHRPQEAGQALEPALDPAKDQLDVRPHPGRRPEGITHHHSHHPPPHHHAVRWSDGGRRAAPSGTVA